MIIPRALRFRVWHNKEKRWIHGPGQECNLFGEMILLGGFMQVPVMELNDCIPVQFSGFTDRNGTEIYEGDWLKGEAYELPVEVVCKNGAFGMRYSNRVLYFCEFDLPTPKLGWTVASNIFERPDARKMV